MRHCRSRPSGGSISCMRWLKMRARPSCAYGALRRAIGDSDMRHNAHPAIGSEPLPAMAGEGSDLTLVDYNLGAKAGSYLIS
jgi:hypothetical protein